MVDGVDVAGSTAAWARLVPSDEATALAAATRTHFAKAFPLDRTREFAARAEIPDELWQVIVDGGYLEVALPPELEGVGDLSDVVVLLEEAGRSLLPVPLLATYMANQTQLAAGGNDLSVGDPAAFGVGIGVARATGHTEIRVPVLDGVGARSIVLFLEAGEGAHELLVVDPECDGAVLSRAHRDHDPTRPMVTLTLSSIASVARTPLSESQADRVKAAYLTCVAADQVGVAAGALEQTITHVLRRHQFGRVIGSFQAVKHQIADAHLSVEMARALTFGAAASFVGDVGDAGQAALSASATAVDAARTASRLLIQMLGAMGVTAEADAHLFLRRSLQTALAIEPPRRALRGVALAERAGHL